MAKKEKINDDYLTDLGLRLFQRSSNWRSEKVQQQWKSDNDQYNSEFPTNQRDTSNTLINQGRLFIPKTYSTVQRILVDVLDTVFFDPEEIISISSWKNIPTDTIDIVKSLINYRLNGNPINFYHEAFEFCLDGLKNGMGIFKIYPEVIDGQFHPNIVCIPYEDVFFDSNSTWKDYYKFPIVHRMKKSLDELKRKKYKNLDKFKDMGNFDFAVDEIKLQREEESGSPFSHQIKTSEGGQVCVYEIWGFLDVNNDGLLESCSWVMGGDLSGPSFLIRGIEENILPYKFLGDYYNRSPFVAGFTLPEAHSLKGKSLPQITKGLQDESNAIRNQRREAVALALRKHLLVSKSAGVDMVSLVNRRISGITMAEDISPMSIRELDVSDPTSASIHEQNRTDQDYYEVTSVPPDLQGFNTKADDTATANTNRITNANKKIGQMIKNIVYSGFVPAFKMLLRLEQAYESDYFIEMVTARTLGWGLSDDNVPAIEIIQGDFDLKVNMGMNKQQQINKWMLLFDRINLQNQVTMGLLQAGVVQPQQVHFMDSMKVVHKMFGLMGEKNIQDFMIQAQQPPMEGQGATGIASQPAMQGDLGSAVQTLNPESGDLYAY